jgi:hypothetical protein
MQMVPFELTDELGKKAAWKLCKQGHARMQGNKVTIDVDLLLSGPSPGRSLMKG